MQPQNGQSWRSFGIAAFRPASLRLRRSQNPEPLSWDDDDDNDDDDDDDILP